MYYNIEKGIYEPCCENPAVEFSKTTCTCCWSCNNCGGIGCTNLAGIVDFKQPSDDTIKEKRSLLWNLLN